MNKILQKRIIYVSILSIILLSVLLFIGTILRNDALIVLPGAFIWVAGAAILAVLALKYQHKKWLRKSASFSLYATPLLFFLTVYIGRSEEFSVHLLIIAVLLTFASILALIQYFLYSDPASLSGIIILLVFIVFGIIMKRFHFVLSGPVLIGFTTLFLFGNYMYAIRCLFLSGKMTYFRNVTFLGSVIISLAFFGLMFKMMHWPGAGPLTLFGLASLIIGTLYLLITLPSSGYIEWDSFHKKILRRILIPWTFIFILYISRFMIPELNALIWTPVTKSQISDFGFEMRDYDIELRKGDKQQ